MVSNVEDCIVQAVSFAIGLGFAGGLRTHSLRRAPMGHYRSFTPLSWDYIDDTAGRPHGTCPQEC